jgi:hypothetical protein
MILLILLLLGVTELFGLKRGTQQILAAHIGSGLARAGELRVIAREFHAQTGRLPRSNEEVGLPPPRELAHQALTSLGFAADGSIVLEFGQDSGLAGSIRLIPIERGHSLDWDCVTASYPAIATVAPQCRYEG